MADDRDNDKQGSERWGVQIPWLKDRERRRQEPPAEEPRVEEEFAEKPSHERAVSYVDESGSGRIDPMSDAWKAGIVASVWGPMRFRT